MELTGKVAFVTGASGGLGRAIAEALAQAGADIIIGYKSGHSRAEETAASVQNLGRKAHLVAFDQADGTSIDTAVEKSVSAIGRLDILINNAAVAKAIPFPDLDALTPELWDWTMTANLRGPYLLSRAAAAHLKASGSGRIVNVAAMAGLKPMGASIAQATSKAGLIHMTRCLAVAMAPDVTVNCVAPGLMEGTVLTANIPDAFRDGFRSQSVLGQTTSISDVAGQVVQYCKSTTVTGQTSVIDGGVFFH
ncbi:MAG: SDR family NAD(P)-dependent oxidoreductase [Pseudomonadota bacterium]